MIRAIPFRRMLLIAAGLVMFPATSHAHLASTGLGPFYDGASHFILSPEEFVPALALSLLTGLKGTRSGRLTLFALPGAWFIGGLCGLLLPMLGPSRLLTCFSFLALGALVAADARLRLRWVAGLAVITGLVQGALDGAGMMQSNLGTVGLLGSVMALFILVALVAALVASLRVPWTRMAVRVAGSWIVAAGLLLFGWTFNSDVPKVKSEMPVSLSSLAAVADPGRQWGSPLESER